MIIDIKNVSLRIGKTDILKSINISFEEGRICLLYTSPSPRDTR